MSKGNPIIKCRVPAKLLLDIQADLDKLNACWHVSYMTLTDWMIAAFVERLKKRARSRKKNSNGKNGKGPKQNDSEATS